LTGELLDPVAAYDRVAPVYAGLSEQRRAYLDAIERLIVGEVPARSRSLLDVGAVSAACHISLNEQGLVSGLAASVPGLEGKPIESVENACASGGQAVLSTILRRLDHEYDDFLWRDLVRHCDQRPGHVHHRSNHFVQ